MKIDTPLAIVFSVVCVVWLPSLLYVIIISTNDYRLSFNTLAILALGVISMIVGTLLAHFQVSIKKQRVRDVRTRYEYSIIMILILLTAVGGVGSYYAWKSMGINPITFSSDTLYEMNLAYSLEGRITTGLVGRLGSLSVVAFMLTVYLFLYNKLKRSSAIVFCFLFLMFMISPRRSVLIYTLISSIILWYLVRKPSFKKTVVAGSISMSGFILLFGGTQYALGKIEGFNIALIFDSILKYLYTSFYVMDRLLETSNLENSWIMLAVPMRVVGLLFDFTPNVDLSIPFVYVPEPANTVPMFYYFYKSSGFLGVGIYSSIVGYLALRFVNAFFLKKTFFLGVASSLFIVGILLSVRECLFIRYDFYYWLITAYLIGSALNRSVTWKKTFY